MKNGGFGVKYRKIEQGKENGRTWIILRNLNKSGIYKVFFPDTLFLILFMVLLGMFNLWMEP